MSEEKTVTTYTETPERAEFLNTPIADLKRDDLNAEIELYEKAVVEIPDGLTNNDTKREFIAKVRAEKGVPHVITIDEITPDTDEKMGAKEGDVVLYAFAFTPEGPKEGDKPEDAKNAPAADGSSEGADTEPARVLASYKGETVAKAVPRFMNGRKYVEVFTPTASYMLTEQEYNELVQ